MDFLVYLGLLLVGFYALFQIVFKIYFQFWLKPIVNAWKPHASEWKNWREIKSFSRAKSVHTLVLLLGFTRNDMVQVRVRQDVSRNSLERHWGEVEQPAKTFNSCLYYEYKVTPAHTRKQKKKSKMSLKLIPQLNL